MKSDELYYPVLKWYESEINVLTMDEPIVSNKELEQLYQEGREYDSLVEIIPKVLPDYWEDDD